MVQVWSSHSILEFQVRKVTSECSFLNLVLSKDPLHAMLRYQCGILLLVDQDKYLLCVHGLLGPVALLLTRELSGDYGLFLTFGFVMTDPAVK